jgi:hypothetical protein
MHQQRLSPSATRAFARSQQSACFAQQLGARCANPQIWASGSLIVSEKREQGMDSSPPKERSDGGVSRSFKLRLQGCLAN